MGIRQDLYSSAKFFSPDTMIPAVKASSKPITAEIFVAFCETFASKENLILYDFQQSYMQQIADAFLIKGMSHEPTPVTIRHSCYRGGRLQED